MSSLEFDRASLWKPLGIGVAILFLFSAVLPKLVQDWWSDENYSHGLLVPFIVGYIIWAEWDRLRASQRTPYRVSGFILIVLSTGLLLLATLGSELFTQRVSLVILLAGVTLYFFGARVLRILLVPFLLLLLSIPIPQILFNKIALPLQMLASKMAAYCLLVLGIGPTRSGNVIEIVPRGTDQIVGLEVVEACSGIRSLMTLAALAVILVYLTRDREGRDGDSFFSFVRNIDFARGLILVLSAAPIALFTNALRVTATGVATYYWGREAAVGPGHDALGWVTFFAGLVLLLFENEILRRVLGRWKESEFQLADLPSPRSAPVTPAGSVVTVLLVLVVAGVSINWLANRGEATIARRPLVEMPQKIGEWSKHGRDTKFNVGTESVLRATDYVMRNYYTDDGREANLYVGYYDSQRMGATYHSPKSCLPGSGWQMTGGKTLNLRTPAGRNLEVNRYVVERGDHREVMIYWYQGRGRTSSNEYLDKLYKIYDSVALRRSDGAMVRIMTRVIDGNEQQADSDAADFAANVADGLGPFVPE